LRKQDPETQLQIAAVNLMRHVLPVGAVIHHSHNEGRRSKRDAGIAKAMGQRAGFADLMILYDSRAYFIEFKSMEGRQSKAQKEFEADIVATGFPHYEIVRSIPGLVGVLRAWGLEARRIGNMASVPDPFRAGQIDK
jgi:hypothetical protein